MEQDKMRTRQLQEIEYVAENYSSLCSLDDTVKMNHILTSSVRYCLQMLMKFTLKQKASVLPTEFSLQGISSLSVKVGSRQTASTQCRSK